MKNEREFRHVRVVGQVNQLGRWAIFQPSAGLPEDAEDHILVAIFVASVYHFKSLSNRGGQDRGIAWSPHLCYPSLPLKMQPVGFWVRKYLFSIASITARSLGTRR